VIELVLSLTRSGNVGVAFCLDNVVDNSLDC
jgi:hypothetical protein